MHLHMQIKAELSSGAAIRRRDAMQCRASYACVSKDWVVLLRLLLSQSPAAGSHLVHNGSRLVWGA